MRKRVMHRGRRDGSLLPAQRQVGRRAGTPALVHHRVDGVLEQPAQAIVELTAGGRLARGRQQDAEVVLRVAVLGGAPMLPRQGRVAVDEPRRPVAPVGREPRRDPRSVDGVQPERQQLVGEGVPDRERLVHRGHLTVLPTRRERLLGRAERLAEHDRGIGRRPIRFPGQEAQPRRERRELVRQLDRAVRVAVTDEPGEDQQRRILGDADRELAAAHQRVELREPALAQQEGEQRLPRRRQPSPRDEGQLVGFECAFRGRPPGGEAPADDLRGRPRRRIVDGSARADAQVAAGHAAQDRGPLLHARDGAFACRRVVVLTGRRERLGQLAEGVPRVHVDALVSCVHIQHGGLRPRALRGESPVLC